MKESLIQLLTAGIGTLGFSIYFRVSARNVAASTASGVLGWAVYLLVYHFSKSLFLANFVAACAVCGWSELMAHKLKTPVTIFLVTGCIPLLPGGLLYYTMDALLQNDTALFRTNAADTLLVTFGLASGIVVTAILASQLRKRKKASKTPD